MKCIDKLKELPFINDLQGKGAKVYAVGGAVRDHYLGRESKDLDIMVCNISLDELVTILEKYGQVDQVGKSYGILKWKTSKMEEPVDIGLPRRDRKGDGEGHKAIIAEVDTMMPIEEELSRRDFTFNAMAIGLDGKLIDPFNGRQDLAKKKVKMVDKKSFADDPLRMLRAVQFACRFNFDIEGKTLNEIKKNAYNLKTISSERIVTEFQKMVKSDNITKGLKYFIGTKLHRSLPGLDHWRSINHNYADYNLKGKIKTVAEFIWMFGAAGDCTRIAETLGCDNQTIKDIAHFEKLQCLCNVKRIRLAMFEGLINGSTVLDSTLFSLYEGINPLKIAGGGYETRHLRYEVGRFQTIKKVIYEFKNEFFPRNFKELAVNGNDLLEWGYKGEAIGTALKNVVRAIMDRVIENDKKEIQYYLRR